MEILLSTTDVIRAVMPKAAASAESWASAFDHAFDFFFIEEAADQAAFFAQVAHESNELQRLEENLIYTAERLVQVWPSRFPTVEFARQYERAPHKLADFVYANRMGNRDPESGDGWLYRGRGPIQLTGADNYRSLAAVIGEPSIVLVPDALLTKRIGALGAAWFWSKNKLSLLAVDNPGDDVRKDFETITRKINGGLTGQEARARYWKTARRAYGLKEV
jgi:putative chitinase